MDRDQFKDIIGASTEATLQETAGDDAGNCEEIGACCMKPGQIGVVVRLHGEPSLRHHLLEMGFTSGTAVEFVRRAPLGDPIDLRLRGYHLSLRHQEAGAILVRVQPA